MAPFFNASEPERAEMLKEAKGLIDFADPYLVIYWHAANVARARQGGPHVDSQGLPDPRTIDHLQGFLAQQGGELKAHGVISYAHGNEATRALSRLVGRFPWVVCGHPSHPAVAGAAELAEGSNRGDVALSVSLVSAPRKGQLEYIKLNDLVSPLM